MVLVVLTLLFTSRLRQLEVYPLPILRLGTPGDISSPPRYDKSSRNCTTASQWVVTTSNAKTPSIAVQVLLDSTNDWCVLVLGEAEGLGYDFPWTNDTKNLIYLPFEALPLLPFKIVTLPSLDVRNIGYLYAISNGARVVLDLEKDNVPIRVGDNYLPLQTEKREYLSPTLEEIEGRYRPYLSTRGGGGGGGGQAILINIYKLQGGK